MNLDHGCQFLQERTKLKVNAGSEGFASLAYNKRSGGTCAYAGQEAYLENIQENPRYYFRQETKAKAEL